MNPLRRHRPFRARAVACALAAAAGLAAGRGAVIVDDFSSNPASRGWVASGDASLFRWDPAAEDLAVTWDSSRSQSLFALPLGASLTAADSFGFALDLRLSEALGGVAEGRPGAMQVAVGLINLARVAAGEPGRAAGAAADTLEVDWFPAGMIPGYGDVEPTLSPVVFNAAGRVEASFAFPLQLATNVTYRISADYDAAARALSVKLTAAGQDAGPVPPIILPPGFSDFSLDAFAILVWNQASSPYDSLFARGVVDNVAITVPDAPAGRLRLLAAQPPTVQFDAAPGFNYWLQASVDLGSWTDVSGPASAAAPGPLQLSDTRTGLGGVQFYRIRAGRP